VAAWPTALWMARNPTPSPKVPLLESPLGPILADSPAFARARAQTRRGACPWGAAAQGRRLWGWGSTQCRRRSGAIARPGHRVSCRWGIRMATTCSRPGRQRRSGSARRWPARSVVAVSAIQAVVAGQIPHRPEVGLVGALGVATLANGVAHLLTKLAHLSVLFQVRSGSDQRKV